MGTVLYARGIFINRCYDELNLSDPGLILSVHEEYLQAGAEILETNTFGANRIRLARHGLAGKGEGDQCRRGAAGAPGGGASEGKAGRRSLGSRFGGPAGRAAGAAGQDRAGRGPRGVCRADSAFWPKAARGGVDLLIIETMPALNEAREALEAARAVAPRFAGAGDGDGGRREQLPGRLFAAAGRGAADGVGRERGGRELLDRADDGADRH